MAAKTLLDCSEDLLLSVLDFLSFGDLLSMSIVNKYIHTLTRPHLYSKVKTTWALNHTPPVSLLLRSILDAPELSSYVRSLRLVGHEFHENPGLKEPPACPIATSSLSKASKLIQRTRVPFAKLWIDELQSGTVDAVVAVLLLLLPNLRSLHLGPNFTIHSRLLGNLLQYALCKPSKEYQLPTFENLSSITFCRRAKEHRHLTANNTADPAHTPTPSSLVSLEVYRLREAQLKQLLSVVKGLQKLHWHWFYQLDLNPDVSRNVVELDTIAAALNQARDTLTDLTIDAETCPKLLVGDYDPPTLEMRASLDDLVHMGKLRRLSVPWVFLMGFSVPSAKKLADSLPLSLELLILTANLDDNDDWEWDDDSIVSAVKSGLEDRAVLRLTKPRRIILPSPLEYGDIADERREELRYIGANAGLELGWTDK
ncbi:DNA mismatch repair protein [Pochonia chlamydosporia 170]|uniref:DNA mismatch repair protein n=1 Tax=Pochonia chlamydosporia 170 TaxID=1380566 RepID=A0A179FRZ9_METCM|nr:DNA mismatch repair protein [Pochonia chlamydosporia 170]OAQ67911.1 DNA mismatch repair protein [Pochonia chlamydosporia 170]